ncbi:MAG TPA: hypothetical protein VK149_12315 [Sideroxyarcus sp.]|nr:hypothetical protein [Sideroxyarcus sp.]
MLNTIRQWLNQAGDTKLAYALQQVLNPIGDRISTHALSTAGLAIKAGGGVLVKTGAAACIVSVKGKLQSIAAATDQAALSGTVTNAKFNVFAFFVDSAGTGTSAMGKEGATLDAVVFPQIPENKALLGFVIINPTGTGNFVGGTTALDDATVVPNAVYVNCVGPFDPTVLIS